MYDKKQSQLLSKILHFLGVVASWIIAVFFIIGSLISLSSGHLLGSVLISVGAVLIIPNSKQKINAETRRNFKVLHFNILAAILIIIGLIVIATGTPSKDASATNTAQVQQPVADVQAPQPQQNSQPVTTQSSKNPKISDDVYTPYDTESYPKLTKKYKSRLDEIQQYRVKAAEMVLASGKCDSVFLSDLSDESTVKKLKFFVDCSSGKQDRRIYLTENEIDKNEPVIAQDEKGLDETEATIQCKKEIEAKTSEYPKVKTHELAGTAVQKYPQSGRVEVHMNFEVTNFYGVEIPYIGHCFFDEKGNGTIKLSRRSGAS